jgi:hypothetical protein
MTHRNIKAATLFLVLAGTTFVSAAGQATTKDPKIGTRVTITGCLHEGEGRDSFVLLGVTERPVETDGPLVPVPLAIYWLDSTDGLKALIGEFVDVSGKITGRREKGGTITVSIDPSEVRSTDVEVASGNRDLDVTSRKYDDRPRPVGTSASLSSVQTTRPVYRMQVEHVRLSVYMPDTTAACR